MGQGLLISEVPAREEQFVAKESAFRDRVRWHSVQAFAPQYLRSAADAETQGRRFNYFHSGNGGQRKALSLQFKYDNVYCCTVH